MDKKERQPDLRIAIISDPHIGFIGHRNPNYYGRGQIGDQSKWLEYALYYFKDRGIDAFVCPGDMANAAAYKEVYGELTHDHIAAREMAEFGRIFRKVFDGTDTTLVTIYGNHDNLCQHRERLNGGDGSPWEDAIGTPYRHVNVQQVKGYTFIGANWGYEKDAGPLVKTYAESTPDKPVFYIQHGEIKNTTCDTYDTNVSSVGIDNVRDFDNVIALFGHTHCPITDERTIWQSAKTGDPKCTVISCSTLNYGYSPKELTRGEDLFTKQALYLTVTGKDICVERLNFWTPEMIALAKGEKSRQDVSKCTCSAGADWKFTIGGEKVLDFEKRASNKVAPEFPEGAVAGLERSDNFVLVFFPAAIPLTCDDDILHSYSVDVFENQTQTYVTTVNICAEYHVDHSSNYYMPYYQVAVSDLKPDTQYLFKIYARDCFQKRSTRPLIHVGKTLPKRSDRLR